MLPAARFPGALLLCLLAGAACQSPQRSLQWFAAAGDGHLRAPGDPEGAAVLDGFDPPGSLADPRPGDQLLYVLALDSPGRTQRWLLHFVVEERIGTPSHERVRLGITLRDPDGQELARTDADIAATHLRTGLFRGAELLARERLGTDEINEVGGSVSAMLAVLEVIAENDELADILWKVVRKPSLLSVLLHLGVHTNITLSRAEPFAHGLPRPDWNVRAFRVPLAVEVNDSPALDCSIVVVEPRRPLSAAAGIVSLVAMRPDAPRTRLRMHLIAARGE